MKRGVVFLLMLLFVNQAIAQNDKQDELLFGVAYYDEYMPTERLDKDIEMMKAAGINFVRIAESTWSTVEPADNVYDFSHIDRVLDAMYKAGIKVIIGTPTYATPPWLVKKYPDIMAISKNGQFQYGARQQMDITNEHYRFHAERVIRKIMEHIKDHPAIIGYQLDNETKHYNTAGPNVQKAFVEYMKKKWPDLNKMNKAFGLDYWSNRINSWEEFPSVNGTINASLRAEFEKFRRGLVTEFLAWQAQIVREYSKPDQFITHNFDFDWRGYSYGLQPSVNHFEASKVMDVAGVDIYHPTQDDLTGMEIAFGGDMTRSIKNGKNYFVIETEAQGFPQWLPYPGQLRLQAFSHLASGASMVGYWHWHSIHNSAETYWKGLLSHDFEPNPTYMEAQTIGKDLKRLNKDLIGLKKDNQVAFLVSNEAQTGYDEFSWVFKTKYNDILRLYYDALYKLNVEVDMIDPSYLDFNKYKMIVVPAFYASSDAVLERLNAYVKQGGHVVYTFGSGVSDENVKVRHSLQPGIINEACGIQYNQFTVPKSVKLTSDKIKFDQATTDVDTWMEMVNAKGAKVLANYNHPVWGKYAAVTTNKYGKGEAMYVACKTTPEATEEILEQAVKSAGLWSDAQSLTFPITVKKGVNRAGKNIHYVFNYSAEQKTIQYPFAAGKELLSGKKVKKNSELKLAPWGVAIVESK
ncbi:beta-galactosidase (plasmid) [Persicobacter psychrovividus]|uniref:Beta-galactosidase n=2 Tax=Persicobacter psychrovividus TaxID=387638 RepID=A0ABM7VJW3_9BACT|nr:beta-galactosidase [Persicobacter psychrovividus]